MVIPNILMKFNNFAIFDIFCEIVYIFCDFFPCVVCCNVLRYGIDEFIGSIGRIMEVLDCLKGLDYFIQTSSEHRSQSDIVTPELFAA